MISRINVPTEVPETPAAVNYHLDVMTHGAGAHKFYQLEEHVIAPALHPRLGVLQPLIDA